MHGQKEILLKFCAKNPPQTRTIKHAQKNKGI